MPLCPLTGKTMLINAALKKLHDAHRVAEEAGDEAMAKKLGAVLDEACTDPDCEDLD